MTARQMFATQPKWLLLFETVLLFGVIGFVDYQTGWEFSMFVFYAVPILMAVWFVGRPYGFALAVIGAAVWWFANRGEHPYQTSWGYNVATMSRFIYFVFVAVGGAALKGQRDADVARIAALERTRQLEEEIVRVSEREQQRIGRDLHDGLCQYLAAVGISAKSLADDLTDESAPRAEEAKEIAVLLKEAVAQARSLARGIFPVQMDGSGLSIALDELAGTTRHLTSMNVSFEETGDTRVGDPKVATQLFRIAQEALSNAMKHSEASRIVLGLRRDDGFLELSIADNGKGFPENPVKGGGLGLGTMNYRARSVGADLKIKSVPGKGTAVTCRVANSALADDSCDHV